jgi:hypothetical protein
MCKFPFGPGGISVFGAVLRSSFRFSSATQGRRRNPAEYDFAAFLRGFPKGLDKPEAEKADVDLTGIIQKDT